MRAFLQLLDQLSLSSYLEFSVFKSIIDCAELAKRHLEASVRESADADSLILVKV